MADRPFTSCSAVVADAARPCWSDGEKKNYTTKKLPKQSSYLNKNDANKYYCVRNDTTLTIRGDKPWNFEGAPNNRLCYGKEGLITLLLSMS